MLNTTDISQWKELLGLLPIKLFSDRDDDSKFILLNGGRGDFCLQLDDENQNKEYYFSSAWSSNTKNFVSVSNDSIKLYNWQKNNVETIKKSSVEQSYAKFYDYLIASSIGSESDVVPFVINIFRKLRNLINEKENGTESLNLLFMLFAACQDNINPASVDLTKWGIKEATIQKLNLDEYLDEFSAGISIRKPDVDLILRHSSGQLFQEAQREALLFNKNLD